MDQVVINNGTAAKERLVYAAVRKYAKEDRIQSWFHFWMIIFYVGCSFWILFTTANLWILLLTGIILSLLLLRFFVIYHDYVHKTILQDSWVARIIFTCFGL